MDYFNAFWFGGLICALIQTEDLIQLAVLRGQDDDRQPAQMLILADPGDQLQALVVEPRQGFLHQGRTGAYLR